MNKKTKYVKKEDLKKYLTKEDLIIFLVLTFFAILTFFGGKYILDNGLENKENICEKHTVILNASNSNYYQNYIWKCNSGYEKFALNFIIVLGFFVISISFIMIIFALIILFENDTQETKKNENEDDTY